MNQETASKLSESVTEEGIQLANAELDAARADIYAALVQHGAGKVTITLEFDATSGKTGEVALECQAKTQASCPAVKTPGSSRVVMAGEPLPGMT